MLFSYLFFIYIFEIFSSSFNHNELFAGPVFPSDINSPSYLHFDDHHDVAVMFEKVQ